MNRAATPNGADLDARIRALKTRLDTAARNRMRAELERDNAQRAVTDITTRLATDFGVTTADQATALLNHLRVDLDTRATALAAALDDIGIA